MHLRLGCVVFHAFHPEKLAKHFLYLIIRQLAIRIFVVNIKSKNICIQK